MLAMFAVSLPSSAAAWLEVLIEVSLKGTMLLAATAALVVLLRRASAAARHLTWGLGLAGLLLLPPLAIWGPEFSVEGLALPAIETSGALGDASDRTPVPGSTSLLAKDEVLEGEVPAREAAPETGPAPGTPATRWSWQAVVVAVWGLGALAVLASLLAGAFVLAHLSRRAPPVTEPAWLELASQCARSLGLRRPFQLVSGDRIPVPCAWGLLRARVLIPASAMSWPVERRRVVLLHELAHVARRDCMVQTLAQVACAVFWFHPLAWVAARGLRVERERACDDLVLAADVGAADYAEHLLAVVRAVRGPEPSAFGAVAFARPSQFEGRLLAVLDPDQRRGAATWSRVLRGALLAALVVTPLAALRPWAAPANAGSMTLFHGKTDPEDTAPSELIRAPEGESDLAKQMSWAIAQGSRRKTGFWVAYEIGRGGEWEGGNLSDNGSIDLSTLGDDWPGPRMADVLAGRTRHDPDESPDRESMVVAFHFPARGAGPQSIDRVRTQTQNLAVDFDRQPLFWLGRAEDRESLDWLRKVELAVRDQEVRSASLDAISVHGDGDEVRAHLITVLRSKAPEEVRATAAERMSRFPDHESFELLVSTVREDESREVRESATEALGRMRSSESTRFLADLARDKSMPREIREQAVEALGGKAGRKAEESLESLAMSEEEAEDLTEELTEETIETMKESKKTSQVKIVPREDGQDLIVYDEHGDPEVTIQQRRDHKGKFKQEIRASKRHEGKADDGENEEIQRQAVQALARLPEETSVPKLVKIARTHPSTAVRREAVSALGDLGCDTAIEALHQIAWQDHDEEVCRQAVNALNETEGSLNEIIELSKRHESIAVRRQATQALGQRGPERKVLETLDELVRSDPDQEVQREAVSAISELPEEISLPRLEKIARTHRNAAVRRQAIDQLSNFDPEKVTPILESLVGK